MRSGQAVGGTEGKGREGDARSYEESIGKKENWNWNWDCGCCAFERDSQSPAMGEWGKRDGADTDGRYLPYLCEEVIGEERDYRKIRQMWKFLFIHCLY